MIRRLALLALGCGLAFSPAGGNGRVEAQARPAAVEVAGYKVVNVYPHDPSAYTQGLVFVDGFLYESTGLHGRSSVRKVRLETGEVLERYMVNAAHFAEGLAAWRDKLIQITWQSGLGFVYDRKTMRPVASFRYAGEGWGLTHDGERLILSDGSANLRFLHPESFREMGRIVVRDRGVPVTQLNELEYIDGEIFANVWHTNRLARIDPATGEVRGWVDLSGLLPKGAVSDPEAVLNGIAYDSDNERLFVTGKLWPKLYEIRLVRPGARR